MLSVVSMFQIIGGRAFGDCSRVWCGRRLGSDKFLTPPTSQTRVTSTATRSCEGVSTLARTCRQEHASERTFSTMLTDHRDGQMLNPNFLHFAALLWSAPYTTKDRNRVLPAVIID